MENQKLKLTGTKLGILVAKASETNVEIPTQIQIITATTRNEYVNGIATDTISKIALTALDEKAVQAATAAEIDLTDMPAFIVEIQDKNLVNKLATQTEKLIGQKLSTENSLIALRWVSKGQSGSWNGLKLILTQIKTAISSRG
ncbi:hypothetical protein ACWN8B_05740 [Vagococcus zengguangii]|uniref:Uncharacterized protein n=1 Tax=Vagococcus zengguangii TaxID=2571750 RepID=A0A4D7CYF5_9ENTE|nr:hypothetical protein [Vagococcus zengguangii]QCI86900.1 hypothetical protein FA707_07930 [Vagococcus zengguangii]